MSCKTMNGRRGSAGTALRRAAVSAAAAVALASAPAGAAAEPKYKAIFEPVSYSEDLELKSAFFVDEDTGWVSGEAGTILHTRDGGATWSAQMGGDPQGSEAAIDDLFFLDRHTGWAVGGTENTVQRKLLGTRDGQTWRQVGVVGTPLGSYSDYVFTSPTTGLFIEGSTASVSSIQRTRDGGRTWAPVLQACQAKVRLAGLNKDLTCRLKDLYFLTPTLGWAAGAGSAGTVFVLRTTDGGATWEYLFVAPELGHPDESYFAQHIAFVDENNGILALPRVDKLLSTSDGGRTWQVAPMAGEEGGLHFVDPEVGWNFGPEKLVYTVNGGRSWASRAIRFPASPNDFSAPSRQRAYVVGRSGMVFRYRVVEAGHQDAESLAAPLLPGVGQTLEPELAGIERHAEALQAGLDGAAGKAGGAGASAPGELIAGCCAPELTALEAGVAAFVAEVPSISARYRSLNLILAGLQQISKLAGEASGIRDALRALKDAPDVGAASTALQDIVGRVDAARGLLATGFDGPPPLDVVEAAAPPPPAFASADEPAPEGQDAAAPSQGQAGAAAGDAVKRLGDKLKKKIKFPKLR
jgi:photosystem II stability/assembly factor-like uncharacterized protein